MLKENVVQWLANCSNIYFYTSMFPAAYENVYSSKIELKYNTFIIYIF